MDAGDALRNWGCTTVLAEAGQTVDGIRFTLDEWSWPRWDAAATTGWLRVWPNLDLISRTGTVDPAPAGVRRCRSIRW